MNFYEPPSVSGINVLSLFLSLFLLPLSLSFCAHSCAGDVGHETGLHYFAGSDRKPSRARCMVHADSGATCIMHGCTGSSRNPSNKGSFPC